jgi:CxxC motif-containing protein (DUF1111 family)
MRPIKIAIVVFGPLCWACSTDVEVGDPDEDEDDGVVAAGGRSAEPVPCPHCGEPLDGIGSTLRVAFEAGLEEFEEEEELDEGIGPVFNERSCAACHDAPAIGGSSTTLVTRFGRVNDRGVFDPLEKLGGSLRQDHGIGELGRCGLPAEVVPGAANVRAHRRTTPLFGLGLIDEIPDQTLVDLAASQRASIRGIPHWVDDIASGKRRVGRFGWKAQVATLRTFSGDAYLNEMGVTSPDFPKENCPQGDCSRLASCDRVADPEDDGAAIARFTAFMRLLAPPARNQLSDQARTGRDLFHAIGCGGCHVSTLTTGRSDVDQLDSETIHPYSDFLLHDMGSLGDGITQGQATGRLMRTAPLWGVRAQPVLLHDGRVDLLSDAIRAHDGQARTARNRYVNLDLDERRAVIAFLKAL